MTLSLIVACARNRVIGVKNDLPWHIPADLKRFKALTVGKPVIMGRKTFESIYDRIKKPLPERINIIVSRSGFSYGGLIVWENLETAISEARLNYPDQEIMVIGGASIYEQALPFADKIYLTTIEQDFQGDAWFPEIDRNDWIEFEEERFEGEPAYTFSTLERVRR